MRDLSPAKSLGKDRATSVSRMIVYTAFKTVSWQFRTLSGKSLI